MAIKYEKLSNSEIMRRFVATGAYFNPDSTEWRFAADKYLNDLRTSAKQYPDSVIVFYKYAGHEDEFAIRMNPSLEEEEPSMHRLSFSVDLANRKRIDVNTDDLYIIGLKDRKGKGTFIVFDKKNKILSFAALKFRNQVGFWQW